MRLEGALHQGTMEAIANLHKDEIVRLRRQLAVAEERAARRGDAVGLLMQAAEARAQAAASRLEMMMAAYELAVARGDAEEVRAEAAEAVLAEARYGADSLRLELGLAEARWQKREAALAPLRRVAEAVSRDGILTAADLQVWVTNLGRANVDSLLCVWLRGVADALAALDAAQEQGGQSDEQETT